MIRDRLIPALIEKYGEHAFKIGSPPEPIATFPAVHPEVGDLIIYDHNSEATIYVGNIAHGHFNPYLDISQNEIDDIVTEGVIEFLEELFNDQVLLLKPYEGWGGGWQCGFSGRVTPVKTSINYLVWSGPCHPEETAQDSDQDTKDESDTDRLLNALSSMTLADAQKLVQQIEQVFGVDRKENE